MLRALKVMLIVFGVIEILLGLLFFVNSYQSDIITGPEECGAFFSELTGYLMYAMISLGVCLIATGIFLIIAARDPLRHINWVKFAILWCILGVVAGLYSIVRGAADFSNIGFQIIMDAVFAVVFLFLYPRRATKGGTLIGGRPERSNIPTIKSSNN